jgi:threonine dehydrogenase-like Zn-dependent dehydrogenase
MQALRCAGHGVQLVEVDPPQADGIFVNITHSGICGTDLIAAAAGCSNEVTLGHEIAGRLDDGTPVAIEPLLPCGQCGPCRAGMYNICEAGLWLGGTVDGGMTERIVVPERCLVELPDALALENACLAEPLAVGIHGLRRAGVESGETVAIVGAGSIGLLAASAAVSFGCDVSVMARHRHQQEMVERLGARVDESPTGQDVAAAAAAGPEGVALATKAVRPGGRVLVLNEPHDPFLPPEAVLKEITAVTSLAYAGDGPRDIDDAVTLLADNPALGDLITHRFPLAEAERAFAIAADRASGSIKVVLETGHA